jgi:CheY-like chemotaxis protein
MSHRILIVDDSKLARMAVAKALSVAHADWTRLEAGNAEEALALIKANDVDAALLDFNMPGRDGLALAAEMRLLKPDMPIAIVSANHQQEVVQRAHAIGAQFLPKPLTAEALGQFINGPAPEMRIT